MRMIQFTARNCLDSVGIMSGELLTQKLLQLVQFENPKDRVDLMKIAQFSARICLRKLGNYSARF